MPDHSNSHSDNTVKEGNNRYRIKTFKTFPFCLPLTSGLKKNPHNNKHQTFRIHLDRPEGEWEYCDRVDSAVFQPAAHMSRDVDG